MTMTSAMRAFSSVGVRGSRKAQSPFVLLFFSLQDITKLGRNAMREHRKDLQIMFQDPYASLDPRMTVGNIIAEPLDYMKIEPDKETRLRRIAELMEVCGINKTFINRYPHEFSGGQRQRIGIARALSVFPKLIVCDEPVSALDVSIQSQIINLLIDLRKKYDLTLLFISHDLSVVEYISDRVAVMYLGRIIELSDTASSRRFPAAQCLPNRFRMRTTLRSSWFSR